MVVEELLVVLVVAMEVVAFVGQPWLSEGGGTPSWQQVVERASREEHIVAAAKDHREAATFVVVVAALLAEDRMH